MNREFIEELSVKIRYMNNKSKIQRNKKIYNSKKLKSFNFNLKNKNN